MENGIDKQLLFLDVFISNVNNNLTTSVFYKSTYTGRFLSAKLDSFKCLIEAAYKISNSWIKSNDDLMNIKNVILTLHI